MHDQWKQFPPERFRVQVRDDNGELFSALVVATDERTAQAKAVDRAERILMKPVTAVGCVRLA